MAKLESNFKNMVLVLTIITLVAAAALGGMQLLTEQPIADAKKAKQESAIQQVLPAYDRLAEAEKVKVEEKEFKIYKAYQDGEFVGAAVESFTTSGFSGKIALMVGFDKNGTIVDFSVLEHAETPGLGAKMNEWFRTDKNKQNVKGLNPTKANLTVSKDGGDVDAITAATISSRAFLEAIRCAYQAYAIANNAPVINADALSGASQMSKTPTDANTSATEMTETEQDAQTGASQLANEKQKEE